MTQIDWSYLKNASLTCIKIRTLFPWYVRTFQTKRITLSSSGEKKKDAFEQKHILTHIAQKRL